MGFIPVFGTNEDYFFFLLSVFIFSFAALHRAFVHLHKVLGSHFLMVGCLVDWMT